jgi:hypothetical protein
MDFRRNQQRRSGDERFRLSAWRKVPDNIRFRFTVQRAYLNKKRKKGAITQANL